MAFESVKAYLLDIIGKVFTKIKPEIDAKAPIDSPVFTGSLSLGRSAVDPEDQDTEIGQFSFAVGRNVKASGREAHAEGANTNAAGYQSHAEGNGTVTYGTHAHAEGFHSSAAGEAAHAEGNYAVASGKHSHAEGDDTVASGTCSHAEGAKTIARGGSQHVQGRLNVEDTAGRYAHIVGNGVYSRSNAHTLDWQGNAWFAGNVKVGGTDYDDASPLLTAADLPSVPTAESDLIHDMDYQTAADVSTAIAGKQDALTWDARPTANSTNPARSGGIYTAISEVIQVAEGKTKTYVFDTVAQLDTWLNDPTHTADLKTGDVFLIRATEVPDYWWDGTTGTKQLLETTKVDLTGYVQERDLAAVATSGAYSDLFGAPNLATVATSGSYNDLSGKPAIPTVPTNVSAFANDAGYLTQHQSLVGYTKDADLAAVAKSGAYADLSGKPTIPTVPTNVSAFTNDAGYALDADLAKVAKTGKYSSLTGKPSKLVQGSDKAYTVVVASSAPASGTADSVITLVV